MSAITTHVLDTALGRPAAGVPVRLQAIDAGTAEVTDIAAATTDSDGRATDLGPDRVEPGTYRLAFDTGAYFAASAQDGFFPEVTVTFAIAEPEQHLHVPLLLGPYAYSTYRGS